MLLSLIRMIQAFRDYQRNVSELSQLSDRELADIGLDRSDIPRVAAGNYQRLIDFSRLTNGQRPLSLRALSYPRGIRIPLRRKTRYLCGHDRHQIVL